MEQPTEQLIRDYLPHIVHMSLGTARDNKPWVCEVHFAFDDELNLYFRSLASRRHSQDIALNPAVAGNIVRQHQNGEVPRGVYFEGMAELLAPGAIQEQAFGYLQERLDLKDGVLAEAQDPSGHQFYKITVANWYMFGVFGESGSQKLVLPWKQNG